MNSRNGNRFKRVAKTFFYLSLLTLVPNFFSDIKKSSGYYSNLESNFKSQQLMEDTRVLEQRLKSEQGDAKFDTEKSISDLLKEGGVISDDQVYFGGNSNSGKIRDMDGTALLLASKDYVFKVNPAKKELNSGDLKGIEKWLDPNKNKEKNNSFELVESKSTEVLDYNRSTSFIVPRGEKRFDGSAQPNKSAPPKIEQDRAALIMADVSGSMCGSSANWGVYTLAGKQYKLFKPSIMSLAIAQFYIHERNMPVCGFTFSSNSYATEFTTNMSDLANHYSRLECENTVIDFDLVSQVVKKTSLLLDVYIITDNNILSIPEMKKNIEGLKIAFGQNNSLNRTFFLEWRVGSSGYNSEKDKVIAAAGLPNTYYGYLSGLEQLPQLYKLLNEKVEKDKK